MTEPKDAELVAQAKAGDRRAFEALLERHYNTIYRFAFRWCGNRDDAQDITQNVCIKLAAAIQTFKGNAAFTTWLYRIVVNASHDWMESSGRMKLTADGTLPDVDSTADRADSGAKVAEIWAAVRALPGGERDAILLIMTEDIPYKEASVVLGCSENTVAWRVHEARRKLSHLIREGGSHDSAA